MAITEKELSISNRSYTNKDFASIYPELLDLCLKLTNNWNPSTTNESDPGIVLLKLAAFIADKNNYNIDKNTLECFMPSATQESSMRNLCEMNGYNIGYYKSAVTPISFMYTNTIDSGDSFTLKKYETVVTTEDGSVSYTLINDCTVSKQNETYTAEAIEGTIEYLTVGDSRVIQLTNLDDSNRIYFPESYVAENGVFITDTNGSDLWSKVDNLNVQELGKPVFKFGYDSNKSLPYIQFPSDISTLIGDGLVVRYIISSGLAGNVSANVLNVLSAPDSIKSSHDKNVDDLLDYLTINNLSATSDGKDPETIDEAYNGFKKTVGTFNTLVTCRDYANFIYGLVNETTLKYIVSNIQIADRRTDLNYSNNIVTTSEFLSKGKYIEHATENAGDITAYDLCAYPLSPITTNYNAVTYNTSFKPLAGAETILDNDPNLNESKCISHNFKQIKNDDVYCIKNYYRLNVKLSTYERLDSLQQELLIDDVKAALYEAFNARNVDFGEEIPYDTILDVIQKSSTKISSVILSEPEVTTYVMNNQGTETPLLDSASDFAKSARGKIVAKNVLNGTISLFDVNSDYHLEFGQKSGTISGEEKSIISKVGYARTGVDIPATGGTSLSFGYPLRSNEIIQFIAPNLSAEKQFGSYVNYRFEPDNTMDYTLLEIQPDDWETNYNKYYKKVGDKYVALTEPEEFAENTYYSGAYRYNQYIPKNMYYQLSNGEVLRFVYTDADTNVEHTCIYTATTSSIDGVVTSGVTNIFKSTIDVYPVEALKNPSTVDRNGTKYLILGTSDTIDKEVYVSTVLDNSSLPCYWIMNNENNVLFNANNIKDKKITILLDNGEYFMYSNSAYTELVILGSGTRLTIDLSKLEDPSSGFTTWQIDSENMIDIEEINSKGLAAFGALNWQTKTLTVTPIIVEDMQIKSYSEGDTVTITNVNNTDYDGLHNDWVELTDANITCVANGSSETLEKFINLTYGGKQLSWSGRSRLDISCGPNKPQKLDNNKQWIELRDLSSKVYTIRGAQSIQYLTFNANVEFIGNGSWFDISSRTVDGVKITLEDGLEALVYEDSKVKYPSSTDADFSGVEVLPNDDGMLPINLKGFGASISSSSKRFELNHLNMGIHGINKQELIFIYYDATLDAEGRPTSKLTLSSNGVIRFYNSGNEPTSSVELKQGMNIIEIPATSSSTSLYLDHDTACEDIVYVGKLKLINGLNKSITNKLPDSESVILSNIKELATVDGRDIFLYTDNVVAGKEMDIDNLMDPEAFWDHNNIANPFTIGQIDFTEDTNKEWSESRGSRFTLLKASQK